MNLPGNPTGIDRMPYASGRFYPSDSKLLLIELEKLFSKCKRHENDKNIRAILVPHAGYVYSGSTTASAFTAVNADSEFENIFLIGTSHTAAFRGASVYSSGDFITPLGTVEVNKGISRALIDKSHLFITNERPHSTEHSIEVQLPFIQYYFKKPQKIVPVLIGTSDIDEIYEIAEMVKPWFNKRNLFIISSDFSHYPDAENAFIVDNQTSAAILSGNIQEFLKILDTGSEIGGLKTRMCGWSAGLLLMALARGNSGGVFTHLFYCNSGDSEFGRKDEVVGYHAIKYSVSSEKCEGKENGSDFSHDEKTELFRIARRVIEREFTEGRGQEIPDSSKVYDRLAEKRGAFVTLKINGELRGCIGRFPTESTLALTVSQMAYSSAFSDYRFQPLTKAEYEVCEIEISVISPFRPVKSISEIVPGKHGVYIRKGSQSGTMLPQVATERGWSVEEFLGYTSRDKAGIGWDGWRDAEIFIYDVVILNEYE